MAGWHTARSLGEYRGNAYKFTYQGEVASGNQKALECTGVHQSASERSATFHWKTVVPMGVRVYKVIARDCFVHYAQTEREYKTAHNRVGQVRAARHPFNPNHFAWPWATHAAELEPSLK